MARAHALSLESLETLGSRRLAELLLELGRADAAIKRRLRLELAGQKGPAEAVREIRKRLITLARARSFIEGQAVRTLAADLDTQRAAIVRQVAPQDPSEALDLMWRFFALAETVHNRCDDSNGTVSAVFRTAITDLGSIAAAAQPDTQKLAAGMFAMLTGNDYGQCDGLIAALAPVLGKSGLDHLRTLVTAYGNQVVERPADKDRRVVGWSLSGKIYQDELEQKGRQILIRGVLKEIADALGDADGFAAQYDARTRKVPRIAAAIAQRLVHAGRAREALETLDAAERPQTDRTGPDFAWDDARIAALEALGRKDAAQQQRWTCFERSLSAMHLRDFIAHLPDFEDFEAEQRAMDHAEGFESRHQALAFLISWPNLERGARLVLNHRADFDGDTYEILTPAAQALSARYPLAATALLRAMIEFALQRSRVKRYRHAADHLRTCEELAKAIPDFGAFETHAAFVARLKREHGRKSAFWA